MLFFELFDSLRAQLVLLLEAQLSHHAFLLLFVETAELGPLLIDRKTQESESVYEEALFYFVVQWRVSRKTGRLVNLKQERPALGVEDDVKAKDLKAHETFEVGRLARTIVVHQVVLDRDKRLDDHVFYFSHDLVGVKAVAFETLKYLGERTLVGRRIFHALRLLKIFVFFVDSVVGEVHIQIIQRVLV